MELRRRGGRVVALVVGLAVVACVGVVMLADVVGARAQVYGASPGEGFGGAGFMACVPPLGAAPLVAAPVEIAYVQIGAGTRILDRRGGVEREAGPADLRPGQRLRIRETGGRLFSYPQQVQVSQIVIVADGPEDELSCRWESGLRSR